MPFHLTERNKYIEVEFVDDAGAPIPISTATTKQIVIRKPGEAAEALTAVFTTNGTDGKIRYNATASDFFDAKGEWAHYGIAEAAGFRWITEIGYFKVDPNLLP